jgi:hypothetical protein
MTTMVFKKDELAKDCDDRESVVPQRMKELARSILPSWASERH